MIYKNINKSPFDTISLFTLYLKRKIKHHNKYVENVIQ